MGFPVLEGVAGVVISLLIVRVGLELTWNRLLVLMDTVEDHDRLIDAKSLAETVHGVVRAQVESGRISGIEVQENDVSSLVQGAGPVVVKMLRAHLCFLSLLPCLRCVTGYFRISFPQVTQ